MKSAGWFSFYLALSVSAVMPVSAAQPSDAELATLIESAGILSTGYRVRIKCSGAEAQVSTFENAKANNPDKDCKIDAVLIARKLLEKCGDTLARVKVRFYNSRQPNVYREVSVTAGDVMAFGQKQIPVDRLLASLEITQHQEKVATPAPTGKPTGTATSTPSSSTQSTPPPVIAAAGGQSIFCSPLGRLNFRYPSNWTVKMYPDKDSVATVSGLSSRAQPVEIKLTATPNAPGTRLEDVSKMFDDAFSSNPQAGYKHQPETHQYFGTSGHLDGLRVIGTLTNDGTAIVLQRVLFFHDNYLYGIWFTGPAWNEHDAKMFFDQFLTTVSAD